MKSKFKVLLCITTFFISIVWGKVTVSSELPLNQHLNINNSQLSAIANSGESFVSSQHINFNNLGFDQMEKVDQPMENKQITDNTDKLPHDFPLGWYDSVEHLQTPAKIAQEGMNIVIPYTGESNIQEIKAYLDQAAAAELKVIVEIPREYVRLASTQRVLRFVKQFKNHPATYGWYLYDEPDYVQFSPKILEKLYQKIKTEDAQHPIAIAFTKVHLIQPYLQFADIVLFSNYPCNVNEPEFYGFQNSNFALVANNAGLLAKNKSSFWFILQSYGATQQSKKTPDNKRLPTTAEQRYMLYSAVLAKANGLFFWTHYRSQQKWIDAVLTPLIQEFKTYIPTIKTQPLTRKLLINTPQIQGTLYRNPTTNNLLLIAINHGNNEAEATISVLQKTGASSATVLRENREVNFNRGKIKDTFAPYSVHIYQIEPA
jgi:hypothetical protein